MNIWRTYDGQKVLRKYHSNFCSCELKKLWTGYEYAVNSLRKFDFRTMTINGKEIRENVEKRIRNGDMTICFAKGCSL